MTVSFMLSGRIDAAYFTASISQPSVRFVRILMSCCKTESASSGLSAALSRFFFMGRAPFLIDFVELQRN